MVAVLLAGVLALGVLAAALVKLAGDTGPAPAPVTHLLTVAPAPATTAAATTTAATSTGAATTLGAVAPTPAKGTTTTPAAAKKGKLTILEERLKEIESRSGKGTAGK